MAKKKNKSTGVEAAAGNGKGKEEAAEVVPSASESGNNLTNRKNAAGGSTSKPTFMSIDNVLDAIRNRLNEIYTKRIDHVAEQFKFRTRPSEGEIMSRPMVVFLGNHSSGKSSFINHLIGENVQDASTAPMDDGFTLISYGERQTGGSEASDAAPYVEQPGRAVVLNKQLPYASLQNLGNNFVGRLRMKLVKNKLLRDVTLVDSPGMIDSVADERDYDFLTAVKWFVERADFVLFFFDPDKPGTTGESLNVFTQILNGIDHKLLIIMNKVDMFDQISDFVRTYGTLCWNLAKVIRCKDMPHIYTTYLPGCRKNQGHTWSLQEFEQSRMAIEKKVTNAPTRHADNMITELQRYVEQLEMHGRVIDAARGQVWWFRLRAWALVGLLFLLAGAGVWALLSFDIHSHPLHEAAVLLVGLVISLGFVSLFLVPYFVRHKAEKTVEGMNKLFEQLYRRMLNNEDKRYYYERIWESVEPGAKKAIEQYGLLSFSTLKKKDLKGLESTVEVDIQEMLEQVRNNLT